MIRRGCPRGAYHKEETEKQVDKTNTACWGPHQGEKFWMPGLVRLMSSPRMKCRKSKNCPRYSHMLKAGLGTYYKLWSAVIRDTDRWAFTIKRLTIKTVHWTFRLDPQQYTHACAHTHAHKHSHSRTHAYLHTHLTQTQTQVCINMLSPAQIYKYANTCTYFGIQTCISKPAHSCIDKYLYSSTCTNICNPQQDTHMHMNMCSHIHKHTCLQ